MLGCDERVRLGRAEGIDTVVVLIDLPYPGKARNRLLLDGEPPVRITGPLPIRNGLGFGETCEGDEAAMLGP